MISTYKLFAVVIALCGAVAAAPVQAAPGGTVTGPAPTCGQDSLVPPGPEADLYLQHYKGTPSARYADLYWCNLILNGKNADEVNLGPTGPEADLYLQHYQGTVSAKYTGLPVKLEANTWRLVDYEIVNASGVVDHPFGATPTGYLLITPERYAAVTIAPTNPTQAAQSFVSYLGKLNYLGDQSIHPFVSHDPSKVGVDQVNAWDLTKGKLTLTIPSEVAGAFGRLIWEPVK